MKKFQCTLVWTNQDAWKEYAINIIRAFPQKNSEELLEDIFKFDFKFDTILQ